MTNINFAACFLFLLILLLSSISKWISIFSSSEGYEYPWWRNGKRRRVETNGKKSTSTTKCLQIRTHFSCPLVAAFLASMSQSANEWARIREFHREQQKAREQLHSVVINLFNKEQTLLLPSIRQQAARHDEWKTRKICCGVWAGKKEEWWKWARNCSTFQLSLNHTEKGGKLIFGGIKISANLELELDCKKARLGALKVFN